MSYGGTGSGNRSKVLDFNPTVGLGSISGNWVAEDEFDFAEELAPSALRLRRQAKMKVFFMHDVSVSVVAPREMTIAEMTRLVCERLSLPPAAIELFSLVEVTDDCSQRDVYVDRYLDRAKTVAAERVDNSKLLLLKVKWTKQFVPHILGEPTNVDTALAERAWFSQVQRSILRQDHPVGERTAVALAGLAMQASLGDFAVASTRRGCATISTPEALARYLPGTVSCHDATYWQDRLHAAHARYAGIPRDVAQRAYVAVAATSPHAFLSYCDSVVITDADGAAGGGGGRDDAAGAFGLHQGESREGCLIGVGEDGLFVFEEAEWQPPRIIDAITFPPASATAACTTAASVSFIPDPSHRGLSPYCADARLPPGIASVVAPKAVDLPTPSKVGGRCHVLLYWTLASPIVSLYYLTVAAGAAAGAGGRWRFVGETGRVRRVDMALPGLHAKECFDLLEEYFILQPEHVVEAMIAAWSTLPQRHPGVSADEISIRTESVYARIESGIPSRANYVQRGVARVFTGTADREEALRDDVASRAEWAQLRYRSVCESINAPPLRRFCRALDKAIDTETSLRVLDVGGVTRGQTPMRTGGAGIPPFVQRQYELEVDDRVDCTAAVASGGASAAAHFIPLLQALTESLEYTPHGRDAATSWRSNIALRQLDMGGNTFGPPDQPAEVAFVEMLVCGPILRHVASTLTHLTLSDIPLGILPAATLAAALQPLQRLESLFIDRCCFAPDAFAAVVETVGTFPRLRALSAAAAPVGAVDLPSLLASLPFDALDSLNVGFPLTHLDSHTLAELLAALVARSRRRPMKSIGLARCAEPTHDNLAALSQFISGSRGLECVDVARWRMSAADAVRVAGSLLQHETLTAASFEGNRIGVGLDAAAASALCAPFGRNSLITRIDFVSCQLTSEFLYALCDVLRVNQTLSELILANNPLAGDDGTFPTSFLDSLRRVKTLKTVDVSKTGLSAAGVACVVAALSGPKCPAAVEVLTMDSNELRALGAADAAPEGVMVADGRVHLRDVDALMRSSLAALHSVTRLSLCDCNITAKGLEVLGSGLMLGAVATTAGVDVDGGAGGAQCGIRELHLRRNRLTNDDIVGFAEEIAVLDDDVDGAGGGGAADGGRDGTPARGVGGVVSLRLLDLRRNETTLAGLGCFDQTPVTQILL